MAAPVETYINYTFFLKIEILDVLLNIMTDLLNMPPEIIVEICTQLPCLDVVKFAKTCRYIYSYCDRNILKHRSLMRKIVHDINMIYYKIISPTKTKRYIGFDKCKYKYKKLDDNLHDVLKINSTREIKSMCWSRTIDGIYIVNTYSKDGRNNIYIAKKKPIQHNTYLTVYTIDSCFMYEDLGDSNYDSNYDLNFNNYELDFNNNSIE